MDVEVGTRVTEEERRELEERARKKEENLPKKLRKEERKKKNKKKKELFDGKFEIPFLAKQKEMKAKDDEKKEIDEKKFNKEQDDYVLGKLLRYTGVHSALRHDEIMNENSTSDMQLIEDEAESVAKRAAEVLKRSKRRHDEFIAATRTRFKISTPKNNISVRNSKKDDDDDETTPEIFNGGMKKETKAKSGSDLLAKIRARKVAMMELDKDIDRANKIEEERRRRGFDSDEEDHPGTSKPVIRPMNDRFEKLADDIRAFFLGLKGTATTKQIMERFQSEIKPADSFIFKSMLNKVATLKPGSIWLLKNEFL